MKNVNYKRAIPMGALLLVVILAVVLMHSSLVFAQARRDLSQVEDEFERLVNRAPYPSAANLAVLEDERDALAFMLSELAVSMNAEGRLEGEPDAAVFSARAQATIERFRGRIEELGIVIPEELEVGFAAYASGGAVPDVRHVPRLMRQLDAIERILELLLEAGVSSIDVLERKRFEFAPPSDHKTGSIMAETDGVSIRVGFTAPESGVWRTLELFAQPARLLEIVEISHRTQSDILSYQVPDAGSGTLELSDDEMLIGAEALSRSERMVAGGEPVYVELVLVVRRIDGSTP